MDKDSFAWMGFRRLSILDLHPTGHQPMKFGGGRYWLTFNGEIYNYADLRSKFLSGVDLNSTGDTAVLGSLLERMPVDKVLSELRGMFSFVWYDSQERTITAARDHFGIKPLYYYETSDCLGIASEMRSLDETTGYKLSLDQIAIRDYFRWGSVQAPRTLINEIKSLLPGHLLTWSEDKSVEVRQWFSPKWEPNLNPDHNWLEETRETFLGSVKAHLVSDVPVGIFLSGGLDSTLIGCAIKQLGSNKLNAFSIGYENDSGVEDESKYARRTADYLGADFHSEVLSSNSLSENFDGFINALDQPTGDGLNTYLVSKITSQHVKVALSGLGADELFSGYTYHRALVMAESIGLRSPLFRNLVYPLLSKATNASSLSKNSSAIRRMASISRIFGEKTISGAHRQARGMMSEHSLDQLLGKSQSDDKGFVTAKDEASMISMAGNDVAHQLLALEMASYLPNTLLRDNDCVSMAHSLELRVPFVDRHIFALSSKMPSKMKVDHKRGKKILREAFDDMLPHWIKDERRKKTFTLPLMKWLRSPYWRNRISDITASNECVIREMGGGKELETQISSFFLGHANDKSNWLSSQRVWQMLVFEEWCANRKNRSSSISMDRL